MRYRFSDFELDEQQRELCLRDEELRLQPRVFDLLCYLVRNRDRVVEKEELLEALWPGMIVVDGALQRVVSLARSALREGAAEGAIRTHARRGYRFSAEDLRECDARPTAPLTSVGQLAAVGEWGRTAAALRAADHEGRLDGDGLEQWAHALLYAGRGRESVAPLERAVAAHAMGGDRRGAGRAALMLAEIQLEQRDLAVAEGWLRRARDLLEGETECRERGLLFWLTSRMALVAGDVETGLQEAERAHGLGRQIEDAGIKTLGLLNWGHALMARGEVPRGAALHDEAAAAVLSDRVESWVGGLVYCGIIWGCRNRADWQRAAQWTEHFSRWCSEHSLEGYSGTCRLHRAEILSVRGDLREAEAEVTAAREVLAASAPWAEGDAWRILGDVNLARAELDAAESAYRHAHILGWDPNPGYAQLLVARGKYPAAVRSMEQTLVDPVWLNRQRRGLLLAQMAILTARGGDQAKAMAALQELETDPQLSETPAGLAHLAHARAETLYAEGQTAAAVTALRHALVHWREVGAPLHLAETHLRLAEWLIADGDPEGAELAVSAAETLIQSADSPNLRRRCEAVRKASSTA
jgi:DNA-binding winged helix-turn-helix (wHTH) protein